jgi:hypothetical protein
MDRTDKLGCGIAAGGVLFIVGLFALAKVKGDSYLISVLAIVGWIVLAALIAKYMSANKKRR